MEKTYRLTSAAENDLIEILDYTTQQWGIAQADKYAREIEDCLSAIVKGRGARKGFFCRGHQDFDFTVQKPLHIFLGTRRMG